MDDRSGFTRRAEETRAEWTEMIIGEDLWEIRQPQDFVRGVKDDQTVPQPRSEAPPVWVGPIFTTLSANVPVGATFLPLASIARISAGDNVGVLLDNGEYYNTVVSGQPVSGGVNITGKVPYPASSGNQVQDYESPGP